MWVRRWLRGRTLGLKQWVRKPGTFCSLSHLQWQAAQHAGRPCLAQHFLIIPAGEAPPPLVPTAPGTHQPSALVHFHFHCRLTSLFPMRQWLFEERVSFHFAHHPPPPNFWAMIKLVSTRRLDQSTLNIYYLQPTEHLGKPRYLKYLIHLQCGRPGFNPWVGKISWRRE